MSDPYKLKRQFSDLLMLVDYPRMVSDFLLSSNFVKVLFVLFSIVRCRNNIFFMGDRTDLYGVISQIVKFLCIGYIL